MFMFIPSLVMEMEDMEKSLVKMCKNPVYLKFRKWLKVSLVVLTETGSGYTG